jgi:hypothetical protein
VHDIAVEERDLVIATHSRGFYVMDRIAPAGPPWATGRAAKTRPEEVGELTISMLRGEEGNQARELDELIRWLRTQPRPEVVCLSNALLIGLARRLKREWGSRIVCLLGGEDSFLDALPTNHRDPAWQTLAARATDVDQFVAPSRYFADLMLRRLGLLWSEAMRYSSSGRFQLVRAHLGQRVGTRFIRRTQRCSQRVQVHTLRARFCSCSVSVSFCCRYAVSNLRSTACDNVNFKLYLVSYREHVDSAPASCILIDIHSSCQEVFRIYSRRVFFHRHAQDFHRISTGAGHDFLSNSLI